MCLSSLVNNSRISVIIDHMGNISRFYQEVNNKLEFPYYDECWFWYDRKLVTLQWKKRNSIVEQHVCYILARGLNKLYRTSHDIIQSIVISELEMLDLY
jgi:fucose 4-O-acetylase-like acetyltransferase